MKETLSPFSINIKLLTISRARSGDLTAHEEIFNQFSKPVFNLAYRLTNQRQMAEDVLQNTFLKLLCNIDSYQHHAPFGMWLRKVAVNESLMLLRKNKQLPDLLQIDDIGENGQITKLVADDKHERSSIHQYQIESTLEKTLASLPVATRVVIWLKEVEGYSHHEISLMMGKSESYSKSLLSRALKNLRNCFSSDESNNARKGVS